MAVVASSHFGNESGVYHSQRMAEPRPSFTAVNGTGPASPGPGPNTTATEGEGPPSKEKEKEKEKENDSREVHHHRLPFYTNHQDYRDAREPPKDHAREEAGRRESRMSPAPPPASAPTNPASAATQQSNSDSTPSSIHHHPQASPHYASNTLPAPHSGIHASEQQPPPTLPPPPIPQQQKQQHDELPPMMTSPQKRKRSLSRERQLPSAPAYTQNPPPQSAGSSRMHSGSEGGRHAPPYSPHSAYPPPENIYQQQAQAYPLPSQHPYPPPPDPRGSESDAYARANGAPRNEYDPPLDPNIASTRERAYYSDSHMAEALQRENRAYDSMPPRDHYITPEEDDDPHVHYGTFGGTRESQSNEIDRKRRKRVFSNRTKTGCMTCRRRKKKCDEQHPECNNCLRGGFVCEGYTMRNTWQKPVNAKQPIPLQSKNGCFPVQEPSPRAPYPPMSRYQEEYPSPSHPSHAPSRDYESRRESTSEHDGVYGRSSPSSKGQQPSWPKPPGGRPYPSNQPAASKYQGDDHRGSIYEIGGADSQESSAMNPPSSTNRTGSAQSSYSQPGPAPNHNNTPPSQNAQAAAQAALTHPASLRPTNGRRTDQYTEREKMLKGMYYFPMTPALNEDREECIEAIWRFNNATNPSHGASQEERTRLFRKILDLRPHPEPPLPSGEPAPVLNYSFPLGSCGERVVVEAPFHCDYGYNITIGDDVLIGADCRISDTCSVTIGARCILSPNVKLVCATYPIDPRRRMGSKGPALGRNIVIEEDCWIGAGVTILAGVRVGKSSTVGAGSLLHQDVPRFTVVAGNPAKVSRGIYDGSGEGQ